MTDREEHTHAMEVDSSKLPWQMRLLMRFSPKLFLRFHARKFGLHFRMIDTAQQLFQNTEMADIHPISGADGRGFVMVLDRRLSLWFFQDGDHFVYDGFEIGEYDKGDVTLFDRRDSSATLSAAAFLRGVSARDEDVEDDEA
jgi:hypothetical protein